MKSSYASDEPLERTLLGMSGVTRFEFPFFRAGSLHSQGLLPQAPQRPASRRIRTFWIALLKVETFFATHRFYLKECAYAGTIFNLTGAVVSHIVCGAGVGGLLVPPCLPSSRLPPGRCGRPTGLFKASGGRTPTDNGT